MFWAVIFLQFKVIGCVSTGSFVYIFMFYHIFGGMVDTVSTIQLNSSCALYLFSFLQPFITFFFFLLSEEHIHSFLWIAGTGDDLAANSKATNSWSLSSLPLNRKPLASNNSQGRI